MPLVMNHFKKILFLFMCVGLLTVPYVPVLAVTTTDSSNEWCGEHTLAQVVPTLGTTNEITAAPGRTVSVPVFVKNMDTVTAQYVSVYAVVYAPSGAYLSVLPVAHALELDPGEIYEATAAWIVPSVLTAGTYQISAFVAQANQQEVYNDIVRSVIENPAPSEETTVTVRVATDTESEQIEPQDYIAAQTLNNSELPTQLIATAPVIEGDNVVYTVTIRNPQTQAPLQATLQLRAFDGMTPDASTVLAERQTEVRLLPGESRTVTFEFSKFFSTQSVQLIEASLMTVGQVADIARSYTILPQYDTALQDGLKTQARIDRIFVDDTDVTVCAVVDTVNQNTDTTAVTLQMFDGVPELVLFEKTLAVPENYQGYMLTKIPRSVLGFDTVYSAVLAVTDTELGVVTEHTMRSFSIASTTDAQLGDNHFSDYALQKTIKIAMFVVGVLLLLTVFAFVAVLVQRKKKSINPLV